jgi:exopolysaccharide biosynthesis polyprenyl glycosylphosphotransferase
MAPDVTSQLSKILSSALWATGSGFIVASSLGQLPEAGHFGWLLLTVAVSMTLGTHAVSLLLKRFWQAGHLRTRAIVIGSTRLTPEVASELLVRRSCGVDVVAVINTDNFSTTGEGLLQEVKTRTEATGAARLIVAPFNERSRSVLRTARWAGTAGVAVYVVPRLFEMGVGLDSLTPERVRGYPLVRVQPSPHPVVSMRLKRVFDVVAATSALLLLAPLMAAASLAVRLTSPGPVLFAQQRVGRGGRPITVYKFRSMTDAGDPDTEWVSESRVTRVGSVLRRTAVDELPQLYSVIKGEMSLVGPRPERPAFVEQFRLEMDDYDDRHRMAPGLTGLAQIVGLVGDSPIAERVKHDNLYIDHWSFMGDLEIIVKTVWAIMHQGRYKQRQIDLAAALSSEWSEISTSFFKPNPDDDVIDLRVTSTHDELTSVG